MADLSHSASGSEPPTASVRLATAQRMITALARLGAPTTERSKVQRVINGLGTLVQMLEVEEQAGQGAAAATLANQRLAAESAERYDAARAGVPECSLMSEPAAQGTDARAGQRAGG